MSRRVDTTLCLVVAWLVLALAIAGWWSRLADDAPFREQYFSADLVVWPTIIEDVLIRGNPYARAWHLTQAPYFVPDALFALGTRALGETIEGRQYANILAQLLCLVLALVALTRAVDDQLTPIAPAIVALCVAFALNDRQPFTFFLYPAYHVGVAILGAAALALWLRPSRSRLFVLALVLTAGAASDPLLTVFWLGGLPLAALGVMQVESKASALERVVLPGAWGVAGCIAGWALSKTIPFPDRSQPVEGLAALGQTLEAAWVHWSSFDGVFRALLLIGTAALALVALRSTDEARRRTALFLLGGTIATIAMVIIAGKLVDGGWHRYLLWPIVAACLGVLLALPALAARWAATLVAAGLVLHAVAQRPLQVPLSAPPSQWRADVECLDRLAREEAVSGIAGYWQAKPIALFSNEGIWPAQFLPSLDSPMLWITSRSWYWPRREFGFVVTNGLEPAELDRALGPQFVERRCGALNVRLFQGEGREALNRFVTERVHRAMGGP